MTVTLYHNPACGTSRTVLEMLRAKGIEPKIIEYLKTPLTHAELTELLRHMKAGARAILRDKGELYEELKLADEKWSDDELLDFIAKHPVLMNRPIVITHKGAKLCRPANELHTIL